MSLSQSRQPLFLIREDDFDENVGAALKCIYSDFPTTRATHKLEKIAGTGSLTKVAHMVPINPKTHFPLAVKFFDSLMLTNDKESKEDVARFHDNLHKKFCAEAKLALRIDGIGTHFSFSRKIKLDKAVTVSYPVHAVAMEYFDGIPLLRYVENIKSAAQFITICVEFVEALNQFHTQHKLIHGDVSLGNILVAEDKNEMVRVKLVDYNDSLTQPEGTQIDLSAEFLGSAPDTTLFKSPTHNKPPEIADGKLIIVSKKQDVFMAGYAIKEIGEKLKTLFSLEEYEQFLQIANAMTTIDPNERMSLSTAKENLQKLPTFTLMLENLRKTLIDDFINKRNRCDVHFANDKTMAEIWCYCEYYLCLLQDSAILDWHLLKSAQVAYQAIKEFNAQDNIVGIKLLFDYTTTAERFIKILRDFSLRANKDILLQAFLRIDEAFLGRIITQCTHADILIELVPTGKGNFTGLSQRPDANLDKENKQYIVREIYLSQAYYLQELRQQSINKSSDSIPQKIADVATVFDHIVMQNSDRNSIVAILVSADLRNRYMLGAVYCIPDRVHQLFIVLSEFARSEVANLLLASTQLNLIDELASIASASSDSLEEKSSAEKVEKLCLTDLLLSEIKRNTAFSDLWKPLFNLFQSAWLVSNTMTLYKEQIKDFQVLLTKLETIASLEKTDPSKKFALTNFHLLIQLGKNYLLNLMQSGTDLKQLIASVHMNHVFQLLEFLGRDCLLRLNKFDFTDYSDLMTHIMLFENTAAGADFRNIFFRNYACQLVNEHKTVKNPLHSDYVALEKAIKDLDTKRIDMADGLYQRMLLEFNEIYYLMRKNDRRPVRCYLSSHTREIKLLASKRLAEYFNDVPVSPGFFKASALKEGVLGMIAERLEPFLRLSHRLTEGDALTDLILDSRYWETKASFSQQPTICIQNMQNLKVLSYTNIRNIAKERYGFGQRNLFYLLTAYDPRNSITDLFCRALVRSKTKEELLRSSLFKSVLLDWETYKSSHKHLQHDEVIEMNLIAKPSKLKSY